MLTLKLFETHKYLNGSSKIPLILNHLANLSERLFGDKLFTAHPSLGSNAFTALAPQAVNALLPRGSVVTSTYKLPYGTFHNKLDNDQQSDH